MPSAAPFLRDKGTRPDLRVQRGDTAIPPLKYASWMLLRDLVAGTPFVCGPDASLIEVAVGMASAGHGSAGVIEGRSLVGVFTERDLLRAVAQAADLEEEPVRRWMGRDPDVFSPDVDAYDASQWLLESGYRHLPVVEDGVLLGIVSLRGLLAAVLASIEDE